ncbi:MAG: CPBP family intramembrane glutamic endopeptidase [Candidatus Nitrosocaldaceae archaeon]
MSVKKIFQQILLLLYCGLIMVIAGFMLLSFPIGSYTVFNTDIGGAITYEYPISSLNSLYLPFTFNIGNIFIILWCIYLSLFSILLFKSKNILYALLYAIQSSSHPYNNKLAMSIVWFSILFIGSKSINLIQQHFGIDIGSLNEDNLLLQFFGLSIAPLLEESIFRVILIGLPVYLFLINKRFNINELLRVLWNPFAHLPFTKISYAIILVSSIIFGLLHIATGWNYGKLSQATFAGIILGYVYYRYGLHASIILHWSANYFLVAYGLFSSIIYGFTWNEPSNNPLLSWLDILLTAISIIALSIYSYKLITRFGMSIKYEGS